MGIFRCHVLYLRTWSVQQNTSETVIRGMYEGLARLGLGKGDSLRVLEPSAGIGNFIGLCPEDFKASFLAVELGVLFYRDSVAGFPEGGVCKSG